MLQVLAMGGVGVKWREWSGVEGVRVEWRESGVEWSGGSESEVE